MPVMTRPVRVALLLLLVLPLLLQGASLPHTHFGAPDGFFNQEHDLTLLAIVGAVASLDAAAPSVLLVLVVSALVVVARRRPATATVGAADSRAPPVR
jgi:hypothetical protein